MAEDDRKSRARDRLVEALVDLHAAAGRPSARQLALSIGDVSHTSVADALSGRRIPSWQIVSKIVVALAGDDSGHQQRFERLWDAAQAPSGSSRPRDADRGPLVGRAGVLAEIQSDLRNTGPGGTAAVFVAGESGAGK